MDHPSGPASAYQAFALQQLGQIFPFAARNVYVETPDMAPMQGASGAHVDLLVRSESGQVLLFQVLAAPPGSEVRFSNHAAVVALRNALVEHFPENSPPVVVLSSGELGSSARELFALAGIPVMALADDVAGTACNLRAALESLSIALPELVQPDTRRASPPGAWLPLSLALAAEMARLGRFESLLNMAYLLSGVLAGAALGVVFTWFTGPPQGVSAGQIRLLGVLLALALAAAVLTFRTRRSTKALLAELASGRLANFRFRMVTKAPGQGPSEPPDHANSMAGAATMRSA